VSIALNLAVYSSEMRHLLRKIGPIVLAFLIGVLAKFVWDHWQEVRNFLADPFIYYQD